ncbi:MAG: lipopolysaccharide assembly protein LapA domain-containing protein [Mycobacteriales bacterium]
MTGDPAYPRPADDPRPPAEPQPPTDPGAAGPDPPAAADPETVPREPAAPLPQHSLDRTRTGGLWVAAIAAAVLILLLLIFILQNGEQVEVSLFGAEPNLPLGVALLLAAVLGALVVALLGTARVVQLRHVARRHRAEDRATRR